MAADELKKLQDENKALQGKIEQLTSEKGKAETEKAIAEAQRAATLARLPPSETKPLEGKVSADASVVTGIQRQAYRALRKVVARMAEDIVGHGPPLKTVMLYNERDLTALAHYRIVAAELGLLHRGYSEAREKEKPAAEALPAGMVESAAFAPAAAGAALKSVVDVLALFRTDVDYKGAAVTFDEASLAAEVAKSLRRAAAEKAAGGGGRDGGESGRAGAGGGRDNYQRGGLEVIYSALSVPGLFDEAYGRRSELLEGLGAVGELREEAGLAVAAFDALDAAGKQADPNRGRIARLKALNARYDRLLTGVGELGDKMKLSGLNALLRGELLGREMRGEASAVLFVKAIGGGENKTTRNLWTGGRLYHSGTAVLTYLLFTSGGELALSDVLAKTTPFVRAK